MIMIKYYTALFLLIVMTIANGSELNIVSNELKIDRENEISIFKGNVYAISETFKIWSDELIVLSEGNKNKMTELREINLFIYILNPDFLLSARKFLTVVKVSLSLLEPNFSTFSIIFGGIVIISQPS